MFTGNRDLLRRLENLDKSWQDTKEEIDKRVKEGRADNDGYIITENNDGSYSLVSKEFYLKQLINHANAQLHQCNCEKKE